MIAAIFGVWAVIVSISLLMSGNALQGSLLGLRAPSAGFPDLVTGIIMSSYYFGFVFGALAVPRLVERVGHIRVFTALASLASISALGHAVVVDAPVWAVLRILTGFCNIGLFIIAESWLNDRSTNETRGQLLGVYMIAMSGSMAVGPLLLNVADPAGPVLFMTASILVSLAVLPVSLTTYPAPRFENPARLGVVELVKTSPLGVAGCFTNGATSGALVWLASLYATGLGMDVGNVSLFMAATIVGGIVLIWPIGRLSDRFDRRKILTIVAFTGGAAASLAALFAGPEPLIQIIAVAVVGCFLSPLYSLSIAHTNDHLRPEQMVAASSGLLLAAGVGGILGPTVAGAMMQIAGPAGYFWFPASAMLLLGGFALYRMTRRAPVPMEEQRDFVTVVRTSQVLTESALRDHMDRDLGRTAKW
ncbi:MAG: MFS transporter [bacterium]|nr:MFS transporter [bacterium]MDE0239006.1 MFS transporter [bacterium]MDE0416389.1 MFS transporter [bacterium]